MSDNELMMARIEDMEKRIATLEERLRLNLWTGSTMAKEEHLVRKYGEYVDKTQAAKILCVTRATVYAMLADGRIEGACSGRRVSVQSIARYIAAPKSRSRKVGGVCPEGKRSCKMMWKDEADGTADEQRQDHH